MTSTFKLFFAIVQRVTKKSCNLLLPYLEKRFFSTFSKKKFFSEWKMENYIYVILLQNRTFSNLFASIKKLVSDK